MVSGRSIKKLVKMLLAVEYSRENQTHVGIGRSESRVSRAILGRSCASLAVNRFAGDSHWYEMTREDRNVRMSECRGQEVHTEDDVP